MSALYKQTLSKIQISEEMKSEMKAKMQTKLAEKESSCLIAAKKFRILAACLACFVCVCICIPLVIHFVNTPIDDTPTIPGDLTPPSIGVYSIGQTYNREDGGSVTFTDIRVENNLTVNGTTYRGIYLIITGEFNLKDFVFYTNESIASLFNDDIGENTILRLDQEVTLQLSEADLRINEPEGGETKGQVSLAYRINALTLDFITAHNSDTHEPDEVHGDITLNLSGCYSEGITLIEFIFFCEDVRLI